LDHALEKIPPKPDHPENIQPGCGVAVRLMFDPAVKPPEQLWPVLMDTVPDP
jgi:hypothetical protein